jgi:protein-disulfide isomerase
LNRDVRQAAELQVTGTPTVFVNGRKIGGAQPYGVFARVVEQEVTRAQQALAAGTQPSKLYEELIAQGKAVEVRAELGKKTFNFDNAGSPRLGSATAPIQITVFEDLQCPYCARLSATLASVRGKIGERASVVFKHLPLSNQCNAAMGRDMHPGACHAAFWAMAAHEQNKFWAFSKRVFGDMAALMPAGDDLDERLTALDVNLRKHAKAAGVDVAKAEQYVKERKFVPLLERDVREAAQLRVSGTPSVFINGREYNGPLSAERIIAAAQRVLRSAKAATSK